MNYNEMYTMLFDAITDALDELENSNISSKEIENGIHILKESQQLTEEMFLSTK